MSAIPLELSPARIAILPAQAGNVANAGADRDCLDIINLADDLEEYPPITPPNPAYRK
jgi:hypothetical protein